ncbi:ribbon-helix-helix domain-containing protein [Labrys okinawensis]|uniref:ribbon-helix-helix domain-containing protein n=1 Tax=Labrys okinawensis TaxID=346911 RepID=UPI0039BD1BC9
MPSRLQNHRVWLNGRETDLKLEAGFWAALAQIARKQRRSVECLLCELEEARPRRGLRSAVIEFVLSNA